MSIYGNMFNIDNIGELVASGHLAEALSALDDAILAESADDAAYFMRGKLYWRIGNHKAAITDFETAIALNPQSKARHALEMARDITDYFNPDLLNP